MQNEVRKLIQKAEKMSIQVPSSKTIGNSNLGGSNILNELVYRFGNTTEDECLLLHLAKGCRKEMSS